MKNQKIKSKIVPNVLLALIVHVLTILCMLDIYFTSPLENVTKQYKAATKVPPAKRLVFILADGLGASVVYSTNMSKLMPNLYAIKNNGASWGVAHTIPPTESRPAQIAIEAGFFEDPSAIFKNWKDNKVHFDSVINQSTKTFHFGDPSPCKYVGKLKAPNVEIVFPFVLFVNYTFISRDNPIFVERPVFRKAIKFIKEGGVPRSEDGIIIIVYLVGTDIACHAFPSNSTFLHNNLRVFDVGVGMLKFYTDSYFNDNKTAYILTSDHGMTRSMKSKKGYHGGGTKEEIEVPIMAWGSGVSKITKRQDMRLIDIAPLMSSLLGLSFPTDSLGSVPSGYLNVSKEDLAKILVANALQLGEIFVAKERKLKNNGAILIFVQYDEISEKEIKEWKTMIEAHIVKETFDEISNSAKSIIEILSNGIQYYKSYSYWYRSFVVIFTLLNWILYLMSSFPKNSEDFISNFGTKRRGLLEILLTVCFVLYIIIKQAYSYNYYYTLYVLFPSFTWFLAYIRSKRISLLFKKLLQYKIGKLIFVVMVYGFNLALMIGAFFNKKFLIPVIMGNAYIIYRKNNNGMLSARMWLLTLTFLICLVLWLPLTKTKEYNVQYQLICCFAYYFNVPLMNHYIENNGRPLCSKLFLNFPTTFQWIILLVFFNNYMVNVVYDPRDALPPLCYFISWSLLAFCATCPLFSSPIIANRSLNCVLSLLVLYLLISGGIEPLFILLFTWFAIIWIALEIKNVEQLKTIWKVSFREDVVAICTDNDMENVRRTFVLIFLLILVYFGIMDLTNISCDMNPWTKAFLYDQDNCSITAIFLGLKLVVPVFVMMILFLVMVKTLKIRTGYFFNLLLVFFAIAMLALFFTVRNQGSWRDMGMSVGRFGIIAVAFFPLVIIYYLSNILATATLSCDDLLL